MCEEDEVLFDPHPVTVPLEWFTALAAVKIQEDPDFILDWGSES